MKSILPNLAIAASKSFPKSSIEVASAPITSELVFCAKASISPILIAIGAFERINSAPSSWQRSATFQAIDWSLSAPKIIPFLPLSNPYIIIYFRQIYKNITYSIKESRKIRDSKSKWWIKINGFCLCIRLLHRLSCLRFYP